MSNEQKNDGITEEQQAALGVMYKEAFLPSFFSRLAQHGIVVNNDADASELLKMADMLAASGSIDPSIYDRAAEAQADPMLKSASAALEHVLASQQPSDRLVAAASALA